MVILEKPFDRQIFDDDIIKITHKMMAKFVKKISALIGNLLVFLGQKAHRLLATRASQLLARDIALCTLDLLFHMTEIARIFNHCARRQRSKLLQAHVNPNGFPCGRDERRHEFFDREDHKPPVHLLGNRAGFDLPFQGAGQAHTARANLGQGERIAFELVARLRITETSVASLALEAREPRFAVLLCDAPEKGLECLIETLQHVLRDLRVYLCHIRTQLTNLGEFPALCGKADRCPGLSIGITALLQRRVIEFTTRDQRAFKGLYDPGRWFEFLYLYALT